MRYLYDWLDVPVRMGSFKVEPLAPMVVKIINRIILNIYLWDDFRPNIVLFGGQF